MNSPESSREENESTVERELRRAGERARHTLLREGAGLIDAEQERVAREAMLQIMRASPPGTRERRPSLVLMVSLSAAAALVAAVAFLWFERTNPPGPLMLGPGQVRIVAPQGAVADFGSFTWEGELLPDTLFVLRIRNAEDSVEIAQRTLGERTWSPPRGLELPRRIEWQVSIVDRMQEPLATAIAEAWRSP